MSLCDLPINLLTGKSRNGEEQEEEEVKPKGSETEEDQKDFDFGSCVGGSSVLTESEMCVADEVFFQGQILPLRLSVSSDIGLPRFKNDIRCNSRSESLDHRCCSSSGRGGGGYGYYSSRSSSCRSHLSSSSTNSTTTTTTATTNYKSRIQNQFHTHPSPKPQIRIPTIPGRNQAASGGRYRKSSIWDIFKLGLVRTPEIELQDLKLRTNKSFGSRNSTSSNSNNSKINGKISRSSSINDDIEIIKKQRKKRLFFSSGCKCSASGAIEGATMAAKSSSLASGRRIVIMKSRCKKSIETEERDVMMREKLLQQMKQRREKQRNQQRQEGKGKESMYHNRTFEWLKELSIEGGRGSLDDDDDDAA